MARARQRSEQARSHHKHEAEIMTCRACGTTFDLARQSYYDNRCPDCFEE